MSEIAIGRSAASDFSFTRRAALVIAGVGVLAFIAMLVLGAYVPDLKSGKNGGAHALSNAVTGFSGIVRLAEGTGRNPEIVRDVADLDHEDLAVITPERGDTDLTDIMAARQAKVTLLVLPKWDTVGDRRRPGWVRVSGVRRATDTARVLAPAKPLQVRVVRGGDALVTVPGHAPADMRFTSPRALQTVAAEELNPIVADQGGRIVLGQFGSEPLYVLADPDLLNNRGMGREQQARAALAMLDFLNVTDAKAILFDVTSNGLGRSRSPLKLLFEPPFLGVTLAIAAALLLAGFQALTRFGAARRPQRALSFGKAALVNNTAALVRRAGREVEMGPRYADVARRRASALLRLPAGLTESERNERLDAVPAGGPRFSDLAAQAERAATKDDLIVAAKGLHHWFKELQA